MPNPIRKNEQAEPVFKHCPRCAYSLRGLPVNHICPECGLAYDEDCEFFRATRPLQLLVLWALIIGGGFSVVQNIPNLFRFDSISGLKKIMAVVAVAWCVFVPMALWWLVKRFRAGFGVVVTGDGLLINLPAHTDELIPWENITGASDRGDARPVVLISRNSEQAVHTVEVHLKDEGKSLQIGRTGGVFPTRADVERFVEQVNARVEASREPRDDVKPH